MSEQPSSNPMLKACPFCSGVARWCADDKHDCHLVLCTGCGIEVDFQTDEEAARCDTVAELREIAARKWNTRV